MIWFTWNSETKGTILMRYARWPISQDGCEVQLSEMIDFKTRFSHCECSWSLPNGLVWLWRRCFGQLQFPDDFGFGLGTVSRPIWSRWLVFPSLLISSRSMHDMWCPMNHGGSVGHFVALLLDLSLAVKDSLLGLKLFTSFPSQFTWLKNLLRSCTHPCR